MSPNVRVRNIGGLDIPEHDFIDLTDRVGSTNNLNTVTYKHGGASGTVVCKLTFTYIGGVPSANDAEIATVLRTDS